MPEQVYKLVPIEDLDRLEQARKDLTEVLHKSGMQHLIGGEITQSMYRVANRNYHQISREEYCGTCGSGVTTGRSKDGRNILICNNHKCTTQNDNCHCFKGVSSFWENNRK